MKIVHVCLLSAYRRGWTYQENMLARSHAKAGHSVTVVTVPFDGHDGSPGEGPGKSHDGAVKVVRLPKIAGLHDCGLALHRDMDATLQREQPDLVYLHGTQAFSCIPALRYVQARPRVGFIVDFHCDAHNTARSIGTKILHFLLWRPLARACCARAAGVYCVTPGTIDFVSRIYGVPRDRLTHLPLGADLDAIPLAQRETIRANVRKELGFSEDGIVVVSGGKLDQAKSIAELARAISKASNEDVSLLLFGSIEDGYKKELVKAIGKKQIVFAGWANEARIYELLLASDVAAFPGTQSVLWQQAICCGLPCIFGSWPGNDYLCDGNAIFVPPGDQSGLDAAVELVTNHGNAAVRTQMAAAALRLGRERFSYATIADRVLVRVGVK
jgi:glycosyltransferase involved in cell wall biosynthesis